VQQISSKIGVIREIRDSKKGLGVITRFKPIAKIDDACIASIGIYMR
jgi:hypothetical protein